jgi:hypothetical protein
LQLEIIVVKLLKWNQWQPKKALTFGNDKPKRVTTDVDDVLFQSVFEKYHQIGSVLITFLDKHILI